MNGIYDVRIEKLIKLNFREKPAQLRFFLHEPHVEWPRSHRLSASIQTWSRQKMLVWDYITVFSTEQGGHFEFYGNGIGLKRILALNYRSFEKHVKEIEFILNTSARLLQLLSNSSLSSSRTKTPLHFHSHSSIKKTLSSRQWNISPSLRFNSINSTFRKSEYS